MAERWERRDPPPDPEAAEEWRGYAAYIARVAGIAPEGVTVAALREAALGVLDGRSLGTPARMILHALDAADEGRAFHPYEFHRG